MTTLTKPSFYITLWRMSNLFFSSAFMVYSDPNDSCVYTHTPPLDHGSVTLAVFIASLDGLD